MKNILVVILFFIALYGLVIEYNKEIQTGTFTDDVIIGEVPKYEERAAYSCNSLDTFSYQFNNLSRQDMFEINIER